MKGSKILICLLLFYEALQPSVDPDLGWHLRYGEYFFAHGHVLRDNILSFVWPSYQWVQASWGYDLFVYQLFSHFSFFGLAVASALLTLGTFLIITWPQKKLSALQFWIIGLVYLTMVTPMWAAGMRTPTLSTLFMALCLRFTDDGVVKKYGIWLPILFLIWANLHGGFALGLILVTIFWITNGALAFMKKRATVGYGRLILFLALSWLTPLINPWGIRIYEETFKHSTNVNLTIISEWLPLYYLQRESIVTGALVIITASILIWKEKIRSLPLLSVLMVTTYLAFSANRFVIILGVVMAYILTQQLPNISIPKLQSTWIHFLAWAIAISVVPLDMFVFRIYLQPPYYAIRSFTWESYCSLTTFCSEQVTALMKKDPPKGNGFHPYDYGGYLIWRVPEVKTFIDGRMSAWEDQGKTPPAVEGDWVFMQNGPVAFTKFDREYKFSWAIVPTSSGITEYLNDLAKNHIWTNVYEDKNFSYFVKNTP